MRVFLPAVMMVLVLTSFVFASACNEDRRRPCTNIYEHLTEIANRRVDPKVRRDFMTLCTETWDDARSLCLLMAQNPKDALRCKPSKVHPS